LLRPQTFADAAEVKDKRHRFFSDLRFRHDDPVVKRYAELPLKSRRAFAAHQLDHEQAVRAAEMALGDVFSEAYLFFKPWQRPRFERQRLPGPGVTPAPARP
jgi:hypothetical protein